MEPALLATDSLTPSQRRAVLARGNVLVMAGAGTGKTKTLVARCLDCLDRDRASLDELLIVTFTEAAAAEMRLRLRRELEKNADAHPDDEHWPRQLALFDVAHIGTLHGFCLKLVREHFHELGLDPQLAILDEGKTRQLANETLDEQFAAHYEEQSGEAQNSKSEFSRAVQNLIQTYGNGRDEKIRALVLRLHNYSQTRPDADGWLARQIEIFSSTEPIEWQNWLLTAIQDCRNEWLPVLENLKRENEKATELIGVLQRLDQNFSRESAAEILEQILSADGNWPAKRKTVLRQPLADFFEEAEFLSSLAAIKNGRDPLAEDWMWTHQHMAALLRLAQEFAGLFAERKRTDGVLDFHDLEQFALKLLWDFPADKPTAVAEVWRAKLRFVFVDEYQDINAAQDKIIQALSRSGAGNRFLVGDVKQSIYRFRLADPKIFRDYAKNWRTENQRDTGETIPLSENFRSREGLLDFVNSLFRLVMREETGGIHYGAEAELKFGARWGERPREPLSPIDAAAREDTRPTGSAKIEPRTELLLRLKKKRDDHSSDDETSDLADLDEAQKEARTIAIRLQQLVTEKHEIWDDEKKIFRAVDFGDMAILLRSPRAKAETYAKEFERAGIPLSIARGGFYESSEVLNLLSLLELLDNPLQDIPCIAVLRSPLVGLSLAELAEIRLVLNKEERFWTALNRANNSSGSTGLRPVVSGVAPETICGVDKPESAAKQNPLALKIEKFLDQFAHWRKLTKQVSLSQCLEAILAETYYADWLRAQPRGEQRAAVVAQFLQLAQSFDQFQRAGLFRFLQFIKAQREIEVEPEVSAAATGNAVRLMSIHQSKGLEFPVVAVADLGKNFNEQDLSSEIIFDETFGLCPRVKPPSSGRRYPSLPHWLAQKNQKRELRGEELRLLYVAFTRARDTLILSTAISEKKWTEVWNQSEPAKLPKIADAKNFADWLGIWFGVQSPKSKVPNETHGEIESLRWRLVDDADLSSGQSNEAQIGNRQSAIGNDLDAATTEKLRAVLDWNYPHTAATERKAKASVTELRRAAEEMDDEAEKPFSDFEFKNLKSQIPSPKSKLTAAQTGTAHHKFLQHVSLTKTNDLAAEAERLLRENFLSADEHAALDLDALGQFWNSPLGQKISAQTENLVKRELPFTARFSPAEVASITHQSVDATLAGEFIVVQGVADLVVLLPDEIWLVDFKTDEIRKGDLPEKIKTYTPQLQLYAAALEKIFSRKVTLCVLHFLAAGQTVEI